MTVITTEPYSGLSLSQLLYHIYFELGQVVGTDIAYSKFPRNYIVDKLNDRQNDFVYHSHCLKKIGLIQLKAGFRNYKLPRNCMDNGVIGYPKFYNNSTTYQNLEIKDTQYLDDHFEGWLVESPSDQPLYVYTGESYGNVQMMGVYPAPSSDGVNYSLAPDTGIVIGQNLPGTTNNITGQATGGGTTTLIDSTVDFTTFGLVAGMAVINVSDSSQAVIETIAATTLTFASALTGGSTNKFAAGNSYEILAGEYGVVTSWDQDGDTIIFSSEAGEVANITVPAGNIRIDFIPYPLAFPPTGNDNQYPEIPRLYHMKLAMGPVADSLRTFNEGSREFQRAQYYEQIFGAAVMQATAKKDTRPYDNKPVGFMPAKKSVWRRSG